MCGVEICYQNIRIRCLPLSDLLKMVKIYNASLTNLSIRESLYFKYQNTGIHGARATVFIDVPQRYLSQLRCCVCRNLVTVLTVVRKRILAKLRLFLLLSAKPHFLMPNFLTIRSWMFLSPCTSPPSHFRPLRAVLLLHEQAGF